MKKTFVSILAILSLLVLIVGGQAEVPTDGLVAECLFNGNPDDSSGNGNDGTVMGAILTEDRFGNADSSYDFDGDDFIEIDDSSILDIQEGITVSCWVKVSALEGLNTIIDKMSHDPVGPFGLFFDNGILNAQFVLDTEEYIFLFDTSVEPEINSWHFYAITFKSGEQRVYFDGDIVQSNNILGQLMINDYPIYIGNAVNREYYLNGNIDDVRIYDRALSESEIQELYLESDDEFDVLVLTDSSPDTTVTSNQELLIYGTNTSNSITIESGAKAELINFPGNNEITIEANSENFTVFRSGAVLTLNGEDGTILKFPATINIQILIFNNTSLDCLIQDSQILLGDQVVTTTPEPITTVRYVIFDFSDGMEDNFYFSNPTGLFSYDDTQGFIQITKSIDTMAEDDVKYAKVCSNFFIEGDFDISVDYKLNTTLQDGDQLEFQVENSSFSFFVVRSNESWIGGNNYHVYSEDYGENDNIEPQPGIITNDDHGNMRIVRSGSVITAYAKQLETSNYEEVYSFTLNNDPIQLALSIQNQPHSHSSLDVEFDNLIINGNITRQFTITPAYDLSDLQGTWKVHSLASGSGAPWWERASVTIASDGAFSAVTTESDGNGDYLSGTFSISSDGEVTMSGNNPSFLGNMDSGKSVMVWTDTWSSGSPGTTEIKVATKVDTTYTTADLVGTWKVHSLASGLGAPWWERATVTIASDGTFTAVTTESDGNGDYLSGTFSISSDGEVTMSGNNPSFSGNMDSGKSVMIWTDTWSSGSPGTTEIKVATKVDTTYTTADLVGTWKVHSLASGLGAPWWERGIVTIASDGSYTVSTTQSDEGERNSPGTLSISSDGEITDGTLIGNMDANKTVMVWTDTWISESPGTTEISVLVKELE